MKMILRHLFGCAAAALLLTGCSKPPELMLQRLAPDAPAAAGLPPAPVGNAPSPLLDRPTFGLYATAPSRETLQLLATAPLSPDGRFRAAINEQGLWIARIDGAWLWQVPLPDAAPKTGTTPPAQGQPTAPQQPGTTGQGANAAQNQPAKPGTTTPANTTKPVKYLGPLDWTPQVTLLMRDDTGTWVEINPEAATVTLLPAALQGKEWLTYSPDRKQVLYYTPGKTGKQLWVANADGTKPVALGENVTGVWGPDGKPVVTKVQTQTTGTGTGERAGDPAAERQPGVHKQ